MSPTLSFRTATPATPTPSPANSTPTPTLLPLIPRLAVVENPISTSSCCQSTPTAVVLDIHTRIVIPNYHLFYNAPISSFHPNYHALGDGSLVATPLIADIRSADTELALTSALAMFFFVTTVLSVQYLRRMKIKKKVLFYILTLSQALGLIEALMVIIPFFNQFINCTSAGLVSIIGATLSYSLLMTGILGIKAYRYLNNSRFVLAVLLLLRTAMLILMALSLTKFTATRRLSGSCTPALKFANISIIIVLQFTESAFICVCYLCAVWRHSRSSVEQGRLSLSLSLDKTNGPHTSDGNVGDEDEPVRRGWWDYVPANSQSEYGPHRASAPSGGNPDHAIFKHYVGTKWYGLWNTPPTEIPSLHRKPSLPGEQPLRQPPRTSVAFSTRRAVRSNYRHMSTGVDEQPRPWTLHNPPPSPSAMSRLSRYMPRMQLLKQVLKNELYYTASVTIVYLVLAILMLIGMNGTFVMDPMAWIATSWFVVSFFTMHSFSRVVRRHERETILQHPTAWDPVYRAELEAARAFRNRAHSGNAYSPVSVASRRLQRDRPETESDPFEDPRFTDTDRSVRQSVATRASESAGHSANIRPWTIVSRDFSVSSGTLSYEEPLDMQVDRPYSHWGEAGMLPSPVPSDSLCPQPASACPPSLLDLDMEDKSFVRSPMTAPADVRKSRGSEGMISTWTSRRM